MIRVRSSWQGSTLATHAVHLALLSEDRRKRTRVAAEEATGSVEDANRRDRLARSWVWWCYWYHRHSPSYNISSTTTFYRH
jgi:hypothetical protein